MVCNEPSIQSHCTPSKLHISVEVAGKCHAASYAENSHHWGPLVALKKLHNASISEEGNLLDFGQCVLSVASPGCCGMESRELKDIDTPSEANGECPNAFGFELVWSNLCQLLSTPIDCGLDSILLPGNIYVYPNIA